MPEEADLPEVLPGAALLKPPPPIMQTEANWPLLTVSKGFFEGIKAVRGGTGPGQPVVQAAPSALDIGDEAMGEAGAGWDDDEDDVGLADDDEFADAVKGKKNRQIEGRPALLSYNVNKLSRIFHVFR